MSNERTPWAAYRAMINGRLIALDEHPGIRPVGMGETCIWLMAKYLIRVTGQEVKSACGTDQLAGGVGAGTEGGIHAMCILWEEICRKRNGGFSSLMRGTISIRRTGQPCFGLSSMSGLVARSLPLTATDTGPPWWWW